MKGSLWIALRFLRGRSRLPIAFSHLLAVLGIALGVLAILVVASVMNGFDRYMVQRVTGMRAHIWVQRTDGDPLVDWSALTQRLESQKGIAAVSPVVCNELMIQQGEDIAPVILLGVDLARHAQATSLLDSLLIGHPDLDALDDGGIILGWDLSYSLGAVTVGEYVTLSSATATVPSPFGMLPRTKRLRVVGIVQSGLPDYNRTLAYCSLGTAQYFAGIGNAVDRLEIRTTDPFTSHRTARAMQRELGDDYLVQNWSDFEANLFQAIHLEKAVMFLVLCLMFVIVGFNMSGSFIKLATEKSREFGILRTEGWTRNRVRRLFTQCGLLLGGSGTLLGLTAALGLLLSQVRYEWIKIPVRGFPMRSLPVQLRWPDVLLVVLAALLVSLLAGVYPAARARRRQLIDLLREP